LLAIVEDDVFLNPRGITVISLNNSSDNCCVTRLLMW